MVYFHIAINILGAHYCDEPDFNDLSSIIPNKNGANLFNTKKEVPINKAKVIAIDVVTSHDDGDTENLPTRLRKAIMSSLGRVRCNRISPRKTTAPTGIIMSTLTEIFFNR